MAWKASDTPCAYALYLVPLQGIEPCYPIYKTGHHPDKCFERHCLVDTPGLEPGSLRVSGGRLHLLSYVSVICSL